MIARLVVHIFHSSMKLPHNPSAYYIDEAHSSRYCSVFCLLIVDNRPTSVVICSNNNDIAPCLCCILWCILCCLLFCIRIGIRICIQHFFLCRIRICIQHFFLCRIRICNQLCVLGCIQGYIQLCFRCRVQGCIQGGIHGYNRLFFL